MEDVSNDVAVIVFHMNLEDIEMLRMTLPTLFLTWSILFVSPANAAPSSIQIRVGSTEKEKTNPPFEGNRPAVDIALLLDTSNSMDGLINQAKNQLWTIVGQFAKAKKNGQTPTLRVALLEYGNTYLPVSEGYLRQVIQLTDDLDAVSEALFELKTQGGDEYCGQVIQEALTRLDWSGEPNSYKAIFIAGNEPFTQGAIDYRQSCQNAIEQGIIVNTIHCGSYQAGVNGQWQDGARRAEGEYFNIDQDRTIVHIECPQDQIIIQLNAKLNETYLWYGTTSMRRRYKKNQFQQDANAAKSSAGTLVNRAVTKAGKAYQNTKRDLVDTLAENENVYGKIEHSELPDKLKKMSPAQRRAYVKKMAATRKQLQKKIALLNQEREVFLAKQRKSRVEEKNEATLGNAAATAIQNQLQRSGFESAK